MCHDNMEWLHHVLGHLAAQNKGRNQILVLKSNANLKKSNGKFAWWRESRKPTWGGSPLPPPPGQGGRVGGGLPPPNRPPSTYIRRGRAPPTPHTKNPSLLAAGLLQVAAA